MHCWEAAGNGVLLSPIWGVHAAGVEELQTAGEEEGGRSPYNLVTCSTPFCKGLNIRDDN